MRSYAVKYLLDVNALLALLTEDHMHHRLVTAWFSAPELWWSVCAFTEAGFLRNATAPRSGQITMLEATAVLSRLTGKAGFHYVPVAADWQTLCEPFISRLYGTKQVTDAFLLGLAVREGLVLVTMDKGIVHLAGEEYGAHVLLLA